jgi:hypothetical protein
MWKEAVLAYFEVLSQFCLEELIKTTIYVKNNKSL